MNDWEALDQQLSAGGNSPKQPVDPNLPPTADWAELDKSLSGGNNPAGSPMQGDQGWFNAGVENFNRAFGRIAEGGLDLGAQVAAVLGGGQEMANYSHAVQNTSKQLDASAAEQSGYHPIAGAVGTVLGVGAQAALPIGQVAAGASRLKSMMQGAGTGLGLGFVGTPGDMSKRLESAATSGLLGGALGAVAPEINRAIGGVGGYLSKKLDDSNIIPSSGMIKKTLMPKTAAIQDLAAEAQAAGGLDNIQGRIQPFKDIGIEPTAEQAIGSKPLSGIIGGINNTAERARMMEGGFVKQQKDLMKKSQDLLDSFVPDGAEASKAQSSANYESLKSVNVPTETLNSIKANKSIESRLKQFNASEDNLIKDLPDDNLYKLNELKKNLDDELFTNVHGMKDGASPLKPTEKEALTQASNQLKEQLDKAYPEYANIRKLGERNIMYNKFTGLLKEKKPEAGTLLKGENSTDNKSLAQVYDTLWGTEAKQEYFFDSLKSVGGDVKNAKDLIKVLNMTQKNSIEKVYNSAYTDYPTSVGGDKYSMIQNAVYKFSKKRYQDAMLQLMFSGKDWQSKLTQALAHKDYGSKIENVTNLLGSIVKKVAKLPQKAANAVGIQGYDAPTFSPGAVGAAANSAGMLGGGSYEQKQGMIR